MWIFLKGVFKLTFGEPFLVVRGLHTCSLTALFSRAGCSSALSREAVRPGGGVLRATALAEPCEPGPQEGSLCWVQWWQLLTNLCCKGFTLVAVGSQSLGNPLRVEEAVTRDRWRPWENFLPFYVSALPCLICSTPLSGLYCFFILVAIETLVSVPSLLFPAPGPFCPSLLG